MNEWTNRNTDWNVVYIQQICGFHYVNFIETALMFKTLDNDKP